MERAAVWMEGNLATQGYRLAERERRVLWLGLRFSTGVCLALTTVALIAGSPAAFLALAGIGAVAGVSARHPFDHAWNGAVRHLVGAPPLPPSPARRRHAFKVATAMMLVVAALLAAGAELAALIVGVSLLGACTAVTVANLCLPSLALSLFESRRRGKPVAT